MSERIKEEWRRETEVETVVWVKSLPSTRTFLLSTFLVLVHIWYSIHVPPVLSFVSSKEYLFRT